MTEFFQAPPDPGDPYGSDPLLREVLRLRLPAGVRAGIEPELQEFSAVCHTEVATLGDLCEANPPRHVPYDPWGQRIDEIRVHPAWVRMKELSARWGLVATAYQRREGEWSRLCQFAKLYLFHTPSNWFTCPLAMTDGAARALELLATEAPHRHAFSRLTSTDPALFWTCGQWMTERTGGSDVGRTATEARAQEGGYRLYGSKWFASATCSQVALTLARRQGAPPGSRGLSLFLVGARDPGGALQGIVVHRLKEKLGTRALPTAELTLQGAPAWLLGEPERGVKGISHVLNITRLYNAVGAVSFMGRCLALLRAYAGRREVFGRLLQEQPAFVERIAGLELCFQSSFHLTFRAAALLGREETGLASDEERRLLRLLIPLAKLYTARMAVKVTSWTCEAFGGAGYVEDTGIPRLLRNAQVLSIWEGTSDVISLDVFRAIERDGALEPLLANARQAAAAPGAVAPGAVSAAIASIGASLGRLTAGPREEVEASARPYAMGLARVYAASLMLEFAGAAQGGASPARWTESARRFAASDLVPRLRAGEGHREESRVIAGLGPCVEAPAGR